MKQLRFTATLLLCPAMLMAAVKITCQTDRKPLDYACGDPIVFTICAKDGDVSLSSGSIRWKISHDNASATNGLTAVSECGKVELTTIQNTPGFVKLDVAYLNDEGKQVAQKSFGAAADVLKIMPAQPEPADFDAFWSKSLALLAQTPIEWRVEKELPAPKAGFKCLDIRVPCPGGAEVSGYLMIPENAQPKSCGAFITYHGYGIRSAGKESWRCQPGCISLDINAHGLPNGESHEFYKDKERNGLRYYGFNDEQNAKPETSYFYGMMLRAIRAAQFVASLPEFNGYYLRVAGGSQGGMQALTAAAYVPQITECAIEKPWCADIAGYKEGRLNGWHPALTEGMRYFDIAYQAKRVKCPLSITVGLADYTCAPSGVMALYNNSGAKKTSIVAQQGTQHERWSDWKGDQTLSK